MQSLIETKRKDRIAEITGFFLSLVIAVAFGWSLPDLVWSMWLSSLTVGFAYIVYSIYSATSPITNKVGRACAVIFPTLFFMFHFGGFHYGHAVFLNMFLTPGSPMDINGNWEMISNGDGSVSFANKDASDTPDEDFMFPDFIGIFKSYFWILPIAFLSNISLFRRPELGPVVAYKNVIKLHLLIFIFAGMAAAHLNLFIIYLFTYAWFFFPLSVFLPKKISDTFNKKQSKTFAAAIKNYQEKYQTQEQNKEK